MNAITITSGGRTDSIQGWGFTYCTLHQKSRAITTLILNVGGGDPAGVSPIPYGQAIVVAIALGNGGIYFYQGFRNEFNGHAHPEAPSTSLQFEDIWGSLDRTTFQHYWAMSNGAGGTVNKYFSRINLFQDISAGPDVAWAYLTADNQIRQIIDFARSQCGLACQYGDVDPVWNMPIIPERAISCGEAMRLVMKSMPDMVTKMDYSTTPPTIHFKQRQNCAAKTLPYAGTDAQGRHHKQTDLKPRPDLQVPSVVIQYQITGSIGGSAYNDSYVDAYPTGSTGLEENSLVFPVDLRGPSSTTVKATLVSESEDPTTTAFWLKHKPDLDQPGIIVFDPTTPILDTTINGGSGHPDGITIEDGDGNPVSLSDYPNILVSGQPAAWMKTSGDAVVVGKAVTIRATLKYVKKNPDIASTVMHDVEKHVTEVRIRLTNSAAGTQNYSTTGSSDSGDPIPVFLAYFLWCSINNVVVNYSGGIAVPPEVAPATTSPDNFQWEGEHEIVEETIYEIITPANVLNINGGNPDWASMNAVIYGVDIDFFKGYTSIQFGPFKHLQASEYFEMVMAFRYRQVWDNPNLRNSGQAGSSAGTDIGKDSPKENTTHDIPAQSLHTTYAAPDENGNIVVVQHDANTNDGQIVIQALKTEDGTVDTTQPQVQLAQSDLGFVETDDVQVGRIAKWRLVGMCDSSGNPVQAKFACTDPEAISS